MINADTFVLRVIRHMWLAAFLLFFSCKTGPKDTQSATMQSIITSIALFAQSVKEIKGNLVHRQPPLQIKEMIVRLSPGLMEISGNAYKMSEAAGRESPAGEFWDELTQTGAIEGALYHLSARYIYHESVKKVDLTFLDSLGFYTAGVLQSLKKKRLEKEKINALMQLCLNYSYRGIPSSKIDTGAFSKDDALRMIFEIFPEARKENMTEENIYLPNYWRGTENMKLTFSQPEGLLEVWTNRGGEITAFKLMKDARRPASGTELSEKRLLSIVREWLSRKVKDIKAEDFQIIIDVNPENGTALVELAKNEHGVLNFTKGCFFIIDLADGTITQFANRNMLNTVNDEIRYDPKISREEIEKIFKADNQDCAILSTDLRIQFSECLQIPALMYQIKYRENKKTGLSCYNARTGERELVDY